MAAAGFRRYGLLPIGNGQAPGMAIGRGATGAAAGVAGAAEFAAGVAEVLVTGLFLAAVLEADLRVGFFFTGRARLADFRANRFTAGFFAADFLFFFAGALRADFFFALAMCTSVVTR